MSASAYAELEVEPVDTPSVEEAAETTEEASCEAPASGEAPAELPAESPPEEVGTEDPPNEDAVEEQNIVEKLVDQIIDILTPEAGADNADGIGDGSGESDGDQAVILPEGEIENPVAGDKYYKIITQEDGTTVREIYEYVLDEETGELTAILKESLEGQFDEEGKLIEEKPECEHEFIYTPNKDGTHTVTCSKCDLPEFIETCEYDDNGVCVKCGWHRLPEPQLVFEDEQVRVTVRGAIPENADLKVTPIKEENENTRAAYEEVAATLSEGAREGEYDIKGFLAYDIFFQDIETGNEVEPDGDVTVSLEYKEEVIPEAARDKKEDANQGVLIQHFNEKTDQVEELTEAGKAEITKNDNNAVTSAEFTSDSFSTYVITWVEEQDRSVKINLVNKLQNSTELVPGDNERTLNPPNEYNTTVTHELAEFVAENPIDGYTFVEAKCQVGEEQKLVTKVTIKKTKGSHSYSSDVYTVTLYNNSQSVATYTTSSSSTSILANIDMFYKADTRLIINNIVTGSAAADTTTTYEYQITLEDGSPLANQAYESDKNNATNLKTDADGKLNIAPGETVKLHNLSDGTYTVTQTSITGTYSINDFITKIYESGTEKAVIVAGELTPRSVTVDLSESNIPSLKFKNCYATTNIIPIKDADKFKYINYIEDKDEYELSVRFTGPEEQIISTVNEEETYDVNQKKKVDIVLAIDKSNSMKGSNLTYVINAVGNMVSVFQQKSDVDAKWKVVDFGTNAQLVSGNWINTSDVQACITRDLLDGTNYQAGLELAQSELTSGGRSDAEKIIIFLTDGHPTQYYNDGSVAGGGSYTNQATYDASLSAAAGINCSQFYVIGMGLTTLEIKESRYGRVSSSEDAIVFLRKLANKATAAKKEAVNVNANQVGTLFAGLAGTISTETTGNVTVTDRHEYASNVTMVDKLSEYVEIKPNSVFKISVSHGASDDPVLLPGSSEEPREHGQIGADGRMTSPAYYYLSEDHSLYMKAEYDADTKTMHLIFPDGYELKNQYSYQVKMTVEPSDKAYDDYLAANHQYPEGMVGDRGTDHIFADNPTSEGQPGFYSNVESESKVTYTYKGGTLEEIFPKPVVQVHVETTWDIYKTDSAGKDGMRLGYAQFLLKDLAEGSELAYMGTSQLNNNGAVDWDLQEDEIIQTGKTYILTETEAPLGYLKSGEYWKIQVDEYNKPTVTAYDAQGTETTYEMDYERDRNKVTYKFYFKNEAAAYSLPKTGGNGIFRTTILGVALMLSSVYLFYRNKRKSRAYCKNYR